MKYLSLALLLILFDIAMYWKTSNMPALFWGRPNASLPASDRVTAPSQGYPPMRKPDLVPSVLHVFDLVYIARQAELSVTRPCASIHFV